MKARKVTKIDIVGTSSNAALKENKNKKLKKNNRHNVCYRWPLNIWLLVLDITTCKDYNSFKSKLALLHFHTPNILLMIVVQNFMLIKNQIEAWLWKSTEMKLLAFKVCNFFSLTIKTLEAFISLL